MAATVSSLFFISWPSSALSDVCSQKSAVKDFDERGGKKQERAKCVRRKGKLGMGARWKSLILPCSEFTHSQLPLNFQSPSLIFSFCHLPSPTLITLCTLLSCPHTQTRVWTASHAPLLQLGESQLLTLFPDSFQFGTEPLGRCGTAQCLHTPPY